MNLTKLFEMQKELDDYIVETKGLQGQNLLPQKILALQVELGECANEWRGFKFWSEDKEPNTSAKKAKGYNWTKPEYFHLTEDNFNNPLLEEYVDVIHFALSIGLECGITFGGTAMYVGQESDITMLFTKLFSLIEKVGSSYSARYETGNGFEFMLPDYGKMFGALLALGELLGFSDEQIESAYTAKWKINKQRQTNGY